MNAITLQNKLNSANYQLAQKKARCKAITEDIEALDKALTNLQSFYDELYVLRNSIITDTYDITKWNGESYNKYIGYVNDDVDFEFKEYMTDYSDSVITSVYDKLEALQSELERLEDECCELKSNVESYKDQLGFQNMMNKVKLEGEKKKIGVQN